MIRKLFVDKTNHIVIQFIRYFFVGGIAFGADFGILFVLTLIPFFQQYYLAAATIAFLAGLTINYLISVKWVFTSRTVKNTRLEFLVFALIGLIGLGMNALLIWLCTDIVFVSIIAVANKQVRILLSKVVSTAVVYMWNFFARKFILFK